MLIVHDQVWGRVSSNRESGKATRYYLDELHLLLKEEQTAAYTVEIWKRFRKWGGIPTGLTQNVKDLLASKEVENVFENSDFVYMLNQAVGDRAILAKQLNISPHQLSYVTHSGEGEGLLFYGNVVLPFVDRFPKDLELYAYMTTKPQEVSMREDIVDSVGTEMPSETRTDKTDQAIAGNMAEKRGSLFTALKEKRKEVNVSTPPVPGDASAPLRHDSKVPEKELKL